MTESVPRNIDANYERAQVWVNYFGLGGVLLFFVLPERAEAFQRRMTPLMRVPFYFPPPGSRLVLSEPGSEYPANLVAQPLRAYAASA